MLENAAKNVLVSLWKLVSCLEDRKDEIAELSASNDRNSDRRQINWLLVDSFLPDSGLKPNQLFVHGKLIERRKLCGGKTHWNEYKKALMIRSG